MPQTSASTEILAHWRYPPELWRDFVRYESGIYRKSVRSAKYFITGTLVCAVVLISLLLAIPLFTSKKWNSDIWGPAFGVGVIAAICVVIGIVILLLRKDKFARLGVKTGEVIIGLNELNINDASFKWSYRGAGWQFLDAERKTVAVDPLKKIEILEFKFVTFISSENTPQRDEGEWRVPIQMGQEAKADAIISRLRAEAARHQALPQT